MNYIYINLEKNILKVWISLVILFSIAFAIYSIISYTYLTGFLLGAITSLLIFFANTIFFGNLLKTKRTFWKTFFISLTKTLFTSFLWAGVLISVIFINRTFNNNDKSLSIDGIFNFFTVFGGFLTIPLSIIVYHILVFVIGKKKKEQYG